MEIETAAGPSVTKSAIIEQKRSDTVANENQTKRNVMAPLALFGVGSADSGGGKCACISRLLQQISALLELRPSAKNVGPFGSAIASSELCWSSLFRDFVLDPSNCSWEKCIAHSDDMLWYVPIVRIANGGACAVGSETSHLQVFRRQSRNKPMPGDQNVNWQETVCLNLILQQLDYFVTVAVCTKNSPTNLQIHRKTCQRVYPSPSRRRMDAKGECEEVTYPRIYFAIDSFDEVFTDMVVSDGECICVELVVRDRYRNTEAVIFLGSIRFDVLKHLYDSRSQQNSGAWNWAQRFIGSSMTPKRLEFVKMRGPKGKGFAEMAVTRVAGCGFETPMSENGFEINAGGRFDFNLSRRVSDVGATSLGGSRLFSRLLNSGGVRHPRDSATPGGPPPSVTPTAFYGGQRTAMRWFSGESTDGNEVAEGTSATDSQNLAGGLRTPSSWSMRGIGKALQLLRDRKEGEDDREQLNALLTYITLPWTSILEDLLAPNARKPILTFELQLIQNR